MSKNELIEKAVLHFDGKWIFPFKNLCTPAETNTCYAPHSKFESIRNVSELGPNWIFVCTEDEFNAAADRMRGKPDWSLAPDWAISLAQDENGSWWFYDSMAQSGNAAFVNPMGGRSQKAGIGKALGDWRSTLEKRPEQKALPSISDRYGMEIPWDGRNALPSDVSCDCEVEVTFSLGGANYTESGNANRFNWMLVKSYKVIDERYKPEPTPAKPWFEAGELPPVGTICEASVAIREGVYVFKQVEILKHLGKSCACLCIKDEFLKWSDEFRPIKTDKEKAIEAAITAMQPNALTGTMAIWFGRLYDAGLLRLPDQK